MIKEVRSAVFEEIESYLGAHHTKDGLLEYLQRKEWKFPKEYFNIYGENHTHFDIFDTQEHLDDFIKNYNQYE